MAFQLKPVLKALLFSSSTPLTVKDIQSTLARFHEQASSPQMPLADGSEVAAEPPKAEIETVEPAPPVEGEVVVDIVAEPFEGGELYQDVPSLITGSQIREAMDSLAADFRTANDVFLLVEGNAGWRLVSHPRFGRWVRLLRNEPPPVRLSQSSLETLAIVAYRQPVTRSEIETIRGVSAEAGVNKLLERELIFVVGRADLPGRPIQYGTTDAFLEFIGIKSIDELPSSDVLSPRQIDTWLQTTANARPANNADMGLSTQELALEERDVAVNVEHHEHQDANPETPPESSTT